ncbi:serine hydrolase [Streptomyces sp. DK15]|uniref:D-alanyl-D-alanine carboxypeptidase n=1 Tax=Streptomyces sp. DK15 TaxID=2957499 RepID=UPI0029B5CF06|nr:serine hydrolase [Streptomyces sp. DK15]MDX2389388.1 serine hydrolase [Streptomyces sp. DK15]
MDAETVAGAGVKGRKPEEAPAVGEKHEDRGFDPERPVTPAADAEAPGPDLETDESEPIFEDAPDADADAESESESDEPAGVEGAKGDEESMVEPSHKGDASGGREDAPECASETSPKSESEREPGTAGEPGTETEPEAISELGSDAEPEGTGSEGDEPEGADAAPASDADTTAESEPDEETERDTDEPAEPERVAKADEATPETPEIAEESEAPKGHIDDDGTAATVEHDAEHTSEFLSLKDLAPKPAPKPEATRAPEPEAKPRPQHHLQPPAEMTREAPLPPLELLAELTNTVPPPETPRRTLTRRVKVWTPIVLLLAASAAGVQLLRPLPEPQLVGVRDEHVVDGTTTLPWPAKGQAAVRVSGSGDVGVFGEQKPVPTASVAKVMTAYVVLKGHPLRKNDSGPRIEVDAKTVADGMAEHESRIQGLKQGSKYSQSDMLKMLMIPSGNNIARLLARWDTGSDSEAAFVAKMNAAAKELGMNDTTYTDPSGLDAGTVSTAADQLKLAEAVMKEDAFRAVVALPQASIEGLPELLINNNGNLLLADGLSIKGIKTGSSTPAGGTLMWAAYKTVGDQTALILGTMMDQHVDGPDEDGANSLLLVKENSRKVIEAVRAALASTPVIRKGQLVGHVSDGLGGSTPLVATNDVAASGVPGQRLRLTLGTGAGPGGGARSLPREAKAGAVVGVLTVGDGAGAKSVPVAFGSALVAPSFTARITRLS